MASRAVLLLALGCAAMPLADPAHANLIVNGDFENHSATETMENMSNSEFTSVVAQATGFGNAGEIDLITGEPYGKPPQSGDWKVAINVPTDTVEYDAFSLPLSTTLVRGERYRLRLFAQGVTFFDDDSPVSAFQVGVSQSATQFGTNIFTGTPDADQWTYFQSSFVASSDAQYITMRQDPTDGQGWNHIDNMQLTVIPEPASILLVGGALAAISAFGHPRRVR